MCERLFLGFLKEDLVGSCSVDHRNCSLVIPVSRQRQSDGFLVVFNQTLSMYGLWLERIKKGEVSKKNIIRKVISLPSKRTLSLFVPTQLTIKDLQ